MTYMPYKNVTSLYKNTFILNVFMKPLILSVAVQQYNLVNHFFVHFIYQYVITIELWVILGPSAKNINISWWSWYFTQLHFSSADFLVHANPVPIAIKVYTCCEIILYRTLSNLTNPLAVINAYMVFSMI